MWYEVKMTIEKPFKTIDEYIRSFPKDVRGVLETLRQTIRRTAPEAVETISYQMPAFKLDGRFLVSFAAWKHHIGLYPIPSGTAAFKEEVSQYKGAKGTVRFPIAQPVPYDLVARLVTFRMKEELKRVAARG